MHALCNGHSASDIHFDADGVCNYCTDFLDRSSHIILRDETECVELVEAGANVLVGGAHRIAAMVSSANNRREEKVGLYDDGDSARSILGKLLE